MSSSFLQQFRRTLNSWWRENAKQRGILTTTTLFIQNLCTFALDSTPARRRQRYGDMDYDWDHRVNTTAGAVHWRDRLLGHFLSPYQPTDAALFHQMITSLPIKFDQFTFVDLGSGKGRTLLMASDYPFQKIIGVEILPALHQDAQQNLARYHSDAQKCFSIEALCGDAADFEFPAAPIVLYLFNPLPESGLRRVMTNLAASLEAHPRPLYVLYHNPLLEHLVIGTAALTKIAGAPQYSIYATHAAQNSP